MTICPACSSSRSVALFTVDSSEAAQHFVPSQGNADRHGALGRHISSLWGGENCTVRRCDACGFGYADPYVAGDSTFYNLAYERAGYLSDKWEFQRTLLDLDASGFRGRYVLEAGAGLGFFLDKIVNRYVPATGIIALEFGDASISALRSKGYVALQEDIRVADLAPGFDAIFLFQVVEHMDRLDDLFERLRGLLATKGRIYISVPNPRRVEFNERNGSLLDMPPNHIGRWSENAFRTIGQRHGLKMEALEVEPFSLWEFIRQDVVYAYLRRAQTAGTLANWSRARRSQPGGKLLGAIIILLSAIGRVPVWLSASRAGNLGGSLWVKLSCADADVGSVGATV